MSKLDKHLNSEGKVLGRIQVARHSTYEGFGYIEVLVIKPDRVLVALLEGNNWEPASWSVLGGVFEYLERNVRKKETNFAILNSEIRKVEMKKVLRGVRLKVITLKEEYEWWVRVILPEKKTRKERREAARNMAKDCENLLRRVFKDKLSVKKWYQ